ncbi:acyl-CoA N-acyltransferase [Lentinus brumalis]|uniref:N-alpha-acetyltransferase 40 n=1 Tax=Lentinus brumalis TaxID=2498619 RepID=A0A371DHR8_9APHY|nr:acyl-CoA N-acyltransferase [Polyporus brumalis]
MVTSKVSKALKRANKASEREIEEVAQIDPGWITLKDTEFTIRVASSSSLTGSDRDSIWTIFETNMRSMMEPSSLGWNPTEKKEELFHSESRYIMAYNGGDKSAEALVAYTMFRFEPGYEDEASVYCYELQVLHGYRGLGLGRFLVDKLVIIGKHWRMEKILLTVLKLNTAARMTYEKLGFRMDPSSPDYPDSGDDEVSDDEREEVDYEILSREL